MVTCTLHCHESVVPTGSATDMISLSRARIVGYGDTSVGSSAAAAAAAAGSGCVAAAVAVWLGLLEPRCASWRLGEVSLLLGVVLPLVPPLPCASVWPSSLQYAARQVSIPWRQGFLCWAQLGFMARREGI